MNIKSIIGAVRAFLKSEKTVKDDPMERVMKMVRETIFLGNRPKLRAIFLHLNEANTVIVMNNLDASERCVVIAALKGR